MDFTNFSDEELVKGFQENGGHKFFTELVNRYHSKVVKACYNYVKDWDTAQDLSQEVFIRVLTKISSYSEKGAFGAWVSTIIHNRCMDHLKRDKRGLHQELSRKIEVGIFEDLEAEVSDPISLEVLEELLEKIDSSDKFILLLKYQKQWSIEAIEQATGLKKSAVKMRLKRAKSRLQKLLL